MKKALITTTLTLLLGAAYAQKVKESAVPEPVKQAFAKLYPNVHNQKWEIEDGNYEAEFEVNEIETSVEFNAAGTLVMTEVEIAVSELPASATDYIAKNMPGKKVTEASKMTDANGVITFEAEVGGDDYIFDSSGKFLKKVTEHKQIGKKEENEKEENHDKQKKENHDKE